MKNFYLLIVVLISSTSARADAVSSSVFEMPEGVYGTGTFNCGYYLQFPFAHPEQVIIEAIGNPFIEPRGCSKGGSRETYEVDPNDSRVVISKQGCRLTRFSRNSFSRACLDAAGKILQEEVIYLYAGPK